MKAFLLKNLPYVEGSLNGIIFAWSIKADQIAIAIFAGLIFATQVTYLVVKYKR